MEETDEPTEIILESSRFWIQRVLVPMIVCIGVMGNTVTVIVLTRRRMRTSTNVYLSALAIADIIHLFCVFLISLKHYNNIHDKRYEMYWRAYGVTHWLLDAASSTSVWLTVSFTIERYIAVCHPMRGRAICTESRAKTVIIIVYIFCLATTAGTTFEHQLVIKNMCPCLPPSHANNTTNTLDVYNNNVVAIEEIVTEKPLEYNVIDMDDKNVTCCEEYVDSEYTSLGNNDTYATFVSWYSAIFFGLFPFALIVTFNCFLVKSVYLSQKRRKVMTNAHENLSVTNENRITLMLIGVVIMFLICQTPTAVFLIYNNLNTEINNPKKRNINLIMGNVFNLLITVNGSFNFVLYSLMSKKFRRTFKKIFFDRNQKRQNTILMSSIKSVSSQGLKAKGNNIMRRNASEYLTNSSETQSLTVAPRSKSLIVRPLCRNKRSADILS